MTNDFANTQESVYKISLFKVEAKIVGYKQYPIRARFAQKI